MTFYNLTNMNSALKELYTDQVVRTMVYKNNPLMAMIRKTTDFGGKYKPIPIVIATSQGRSATFANAQGNQTASNIQSFLLTRFSDYSIATIDNQTMLASKTDKMTFLNGSKLVIDSAMRSIINSTASAIYRSGTGTIGVIGSVVVAGAGPFTATITLADLTSVVQFELGMTLVESAADGGNPGAVVGTITGVNRNTGIIVVTTAVDPTATWVPGVFLSVQGDTGMKCSGLAAWLPMAGVAGNDDFYNVNRSIDSQRLAGVIYDGSAQTIEEGLIDASAQVSLNDGIPDHCFLNYTSYSALEKSLGSKVQYVDLKSNVGFAFRGIQINGIKGPINVIPDRNCPQQTAYLLQMDSWCLEGLGEVPMILRYGDGLDMLRVYNADAGEVRIGAYYNISCNGPGYNAAIKLSA